MKLAVTKGSKHASDAGFCCFCQRPDETCQDQRQQSRLKKQDFAASAKEPMKLLKLKGSKHASRSKNMLPLPTTR